MELEKLQKYVAKLQKISKKVERVKYIKKNLFTEFTDLNKSELFFLIGFSEKWYYKNKDILKNPKIREDTDFIIQFIECRLENEIWKDTSYGAKVQLAKLFFNKSETSSINIKEKEKSAIDDVILQKLKEANSEKS